MRAQDDRQRRHRDDEIDGDACETPAERQTSDDECTDEKRRRDKDNFCQYPREP